jgi:hypothetical protein
VEEKLLENGIQPGDVVIVRNPPGYFIASGRSSVSLPFGDESTILAVAEKFGARYLILENGGTFDAIQDLYDNPEEQSFIYLSWERWMVRVSTALNLRPDPGLSLRCRGLAVLFIWLSAR